MTTPSPHRARRAAAALSRFLPCAALLPLLLLLLAGCAGSPPPSTVLLALPTLGDAGPAGAPAAPTAQSLDPQRPVLVVRRVVLPEYLLARRVRFRANDTTVDDWPGTFWAERIEVGMTRELAGALRAALPGWTLCNASCTDGSDGAAQPRAWALRLEFAPLDYRRDRRELFTVARASLEAPDGITLQRSERRYTLQAAADTPQAHAAVLGELLRRVAADVAPALPVTAAATAR
ncbi:ABC-type transport auxiliary lipoprotein family protein [Azohydromonas aeria]|uniref:ABC-type transport auxiliary lipoprotein family protein n=1 Tax=Azohydromonas aeria TaxID=2590212 RepID=UPI0012F7F12B|nr:ABC-type transport auxiliary lipoprotein family protein [Azohydromonas aeria]